MPLLSLLALSGRLFALDSGVSFPAMAVSLGRSGRATARVTFDKARAAEGGFILAAPTLTKADLEALRMSEAVVTTSGGLLSFAALAAREHDVPAVILGGASWEGGALILEQPVFGAPRSASGMSYEVVERAIPLRVSEGDVLTVDARAGVLRAYPPEEREARLALAEALRSYDGLGDVQALRHWYEGRDDKTRVGPWLLAEMADRSASDFSVLRSLVKTVPSGLFPELLARYRSEMAEVEGSLKTVRSAEAAAHLRERAEERWRRLSGLRLGPEGSALALHRRIEALVAAKAKSLSRAKTGLAEAAGAGGALLPKRVEAPAGAYRLFLEQNALGPSIDDLAGNASLGLRRKSDRIRELVRQGRVPPEARAALPPDWSEFLAGSSAGSREASRDSLDAAIKEVWACLWSPASLGARERAGRALADRETALYFQQTVRGGISGLMLTRDLAGASRGRMTVAAGSDQYVIDPFGREILPAIAPQGRVLDPAALKRLARLAQALEDHFGSGMEVRFAFSGSDLFLIEARPLPEETRLVIPKPPRSQRPAATIEGVRPLAP